MQRLLKFISANKHTLSGLAVIFFVWLIVFIRTLSVPVIQQWDEARNAINTQEMLQNGQWLVRYFEGKPDTWELKPPLLIWLQCLSVKVWGMSEFGIRFPSALAALGLSIIAFIFLLKEGVKPIASILCAVFIITVPAALHPHGFLFGDHDAMLCFFQALMLVSQYRFLQTGKFKWAWITAAAFLLGWLTKSIAVCFVLPGIFMLGILKTEYRKNLFSLRQIAAFSVASALITSYYLARSYYQPGYTDMVNKEEWLGRFAQHPDANHDIFYYLKGFYGDRLQVFFIPALIGFLWSAIRWKYPSYSRMGFLVILFTLPIISLSQSKNYWYDLPLLFPIAICLAYLFTDILSFTDRKFTKSSLIIGILILFLMVRNAIIISQSHNHTEHLNKKEIVISLLKKGYFQKNDTMGVYCNASNTDVRFYLNNMNQQGIPISIVEPGSNLKNFSAVIMAKEDEKVWRQERKTSEPEPRYIILKN